jgi:peptide/nickel transport system permease protein
LSFLGIGIKPPTPEWGNMLSSGKDFLRNAQHITLFPGLLIMITILAANLMGDGLRDALDPKLKR